MLFIGMNALIHNGKKINALWQLKDFHSHYF